MSGWVKQHRKVWNHPLFEGEEFSRREAWMWLISKAGDGGYVSRDIRGFARRWCWSSSRAHRFMIALEKAGLIAVDEDGDQFQIVGYAEFAGEGEDSTGVTDGIVRTNMFGAKKRRLADGRGGIPSEVKKAVFARDGHRCTYCGSTSGPFHLDHKTPWSRGGCHTVGNLTVACAPCNLSKNAKSEHEFREARA